jgi:hypothetical protein
MTRDEITRMAREAYDYADKNAAPDAPPHEWQELRDACFATLVAAAEREACAKVCEDMKEDCGKHAYAFAIRARGEK